MPRGGCATGGRECAPHAHHESSKTSGNKKKNWKKAKRWAKDGPMGKRGGEGRGPRGGDGPEEGRGGEGWGGVWGQFFFVWCQIWHLHYTSKSRLLVHNNFFLIPKKSTILGSSEKVRIPPNCKFHRHSLTHPPPSDFLAKFHVLCVIDWRI
jgi:hypothetical protein